MRGLRLACVVLVVACGNVREEPADAPVNPGGDGPNGTGDGPPPLPDADCTMGGMPELCNGIDDNCNDMIDEGFTDLGRPCDGADGDACEEGVLVCSADGMALVCDDATADNAEACNTLDDDCDGIGDAMEFGLGAMCDGPADGDQCADGQRVCDQAMVGTECFDTGPDFVESCNGLDDDCDSTTDEGTCPSGERCTGSSGACVCDTTSGCGGCCGLSGTACFPGTSAQQCGINGQACFTCGNNASHCENGVCRCGNGTPCSGFQPICCSGGPGEPKLCVSQSQQCP
jgi:hypothetical protein